MSDQRRHRWRSGRLISTPLGDNWAHTRTARDPSINNLPLETAPAEASTWIPSRRVIAAVITAAWLAPQFSVIRVPVVIDSVEAAVEQPVLPRPSQKVIQDSWLPKPFNVIKYSTVIEDGPAPPTGDTPVALRGYIQDVQRWNPPPRRTTYSTNVYIQAGAEDDPPLLRDRNALQREAWAPRPFNVFKYNVVVEDGPEAPPVVDDPIALRPLIPLILRDNQPPNFSVYYTSVFLDVQDQPPIARMPNPALAEAWLPRPYSVIKYGMAIQDGDPGPGGVCVPVQILTGVSKANTSGVSLDGITLTPCGGGTYEVTRFNTVSDNRSDDASYEGYEF
jgi:hypothetical protein